MVRPPDPDHARTLGVREGEHARQVSLPHHDEMTLGPDGLLIQDGQGFGESRQGRAFPDHAGAQLAQELPAIAPELGGPWGRDGDRDVDGQAERQASAKTETKREEGTVWRDLVEQLVG
jgi:hypothetical protein